MPHSIEIATSGRAKCRGCTRAIAKGDLRLGERLPNPYAEGEMTLWFHLRCAAYKRPEVLLEALESCDHDIADESHLREIAQPGLEHRRLPRVDGADRAPTSRARCRSCREMIAKDSWRIRLVYYEEGRFNPSGYIHVACATNYLETAELVGRIRHFSPKLSDEEAIELGHLLEG